MANADKVRDIIEKELGVEREKLTDNASFIEDLGADSLDIVELVMEFEKEFNIDIPDEDAEKLRTVGDAMVEHTSQRHRRARDDLCAADDGPRPDRTHAEDGGFHIKAALLTLDRPGGSPTEGNTAKRG